MTTLFVEMKAPLTVSLWPFMSTLPRLTSPSLVMSLFMVIQPMLLFSASWNFSVLWPAEEVMTKLQPVPDRKPETPEAGVICSMFP